MAGFIESVKFFFVSPQYFLLGLLVVADDLAAIKAFILFKAFEK